MILLILGLLKLKKQNRDVMNAIIDLNIAALRESGAIQPDETFIPNRVIDTNISRELQNFLLSLNI